MPDKKSFEERVLEARALERDRYGSALADERGPMPYGKTLSEAQQDEMWAYMDPALADPQAFLLLTMPPEQGGEGLTPLAASYRRYPERRTLIEGAGAGIEAQVEYAARRQKRMQRQQMTEMPMMTDLEG